jgi:hypothetical protein
VVLYRAGLGYRKHVAASCCGLVFAFACGGTIDGEAPDNGPGGPGAAGTASVGNGGSPSSMPGGGGPAAGSGSTPGAGAAAPIPGGGGAASGGAPAGTSGATTAGLPFPQPAPFQPAPGLLRRLTQTQFRNSIRDLLGAAVDTGDLQDDDWTGGFATIGAGILSTSEDGVVAFQTQVDAAVDSVFSDNTKRTALLGCTPSGAADDACIKGFVQSFGLRAWRRPLEAAEVERVVAVATKAATDLGSANDGARWATIALLNSPNFLYRPEVGAAGANGALRFTGHELAGRLAYLILNSTPDKALLDQAASGALASADGIRTAVTGLLDSANGREAMAAFAEEYMQLYKVLTQAKDPSLYPEYTPTLQAAMVRDVRDTWASVAFDDGANTLSVFTTPKVSVNSELAKLYGLDVGALTPTTFEKRSLPADGVRLGVMSKPGFLSQWSNQQEGSPTLRGKFMREALMCLTVPPPPEGTNTKLDDPPAGMHLTKRMKLEKHREDPLCASCHAMMDPLGLPFENFDAIGRYRTLDDTLPVDPSGDFNGKPVANARELGQVMSADASVAQCFVRKYYSYAVGHTERAADQSVINDLYVSFQSSGFKFRQLVLDVTTSDAFSTVAPQP